SEFKKKRPEQKVISWLDAQLEESLFLSALTIGEIQKGITLLPTSKRRTDLENWLESIIYRYDARILPLNTEVMQRWGELTGKFEQKGRVLPFLDSLIAATALAHGLVLITRNENDFAGTGVTVMNIWK
ncbi:MAG: type II toxin-antitoxin system VapC family toxin, partial [Pyrinomonadaceae bacterium]